MSKVSFGYTGDEAHNLLGNEILRCRSAIQQISAENPDVSIGAEFVSRNLGGAFSDFRMLQVWLDGDLESLEAMMSSVFVELGLPEVLVEPLKWYERRFTRRPESTTSDAYELLRERYQTKEIKLQTGFAGGYALARS